MAVRTKFSGSILWDLLLGSIKSMPNVKVEAGPTIESDWLDGSPVRGEYRSVRIDEFIIIENTRTGLGRFGPWRYALTRQGMDAAARRLDSSARFSGDEYMAEASNPLNDTWRRIYRTN